MTPLAIPPRRDAVMQAIGTALEFAPGAFMQLNTKLYAVAVLAMAVGNALAANPPSPAGRAR